MRVTLPASYSMGLRSGPAQMAPLCDGLPSLREIDAAHIVMTSTTGIAARTIIWAAEWLRGRIDVI
jgi:hypothetical protein